MKKEGIELLILALIMSLNIQDTAKIYKYDTSIKMKLHLTNIYLYIYIYIYIYNII